MNNKTIEEQRREDWEIIRNIIVVVSLYGVPWLLIVVIDDLQELIKGYEYGIISTLALSLWWGLLVTASIFALIAAGAMARSLCKKTRTVEGNGRGCGGWCM